MWHPECNVRHTGKTINSSYWFLTIAPGPLVHCDIFRRQVKLEFFQSVNLSISLSGVSLQHVRITRGSEVNKCLFIPLSALKVCISCSSCWRIIFTVYIDLEVYFHRHVSLNYEKLFLKNYWDSQVLPVKRKFDWANFIHTVSLCGRPRWTFFCVFFFYLVIKLLSVKRKWRMIKNNIKIFICQVFFFFFHCFSISWFFFF